MNTLTQGKSARTVPIRAKIHASINFLEGLRAEAAADAERNAAFLEAKCFHTGRQQGIELALFELQSLLEVAL